jgi:hypothetical protein
MAIASVGEYGAEPGGFLKYEISGVRIYPYRFNAIINSMALTADEFLRRFLLHTLPRGFIRIRFFGFMANRRRTALLPVCRSLLEANSQPGPPSSDTTPVEKQSTRLCPLCGGPMVVIQRLTVQQIFLAGG